MMRTSTILPDDYVVPGSLPGEAGVVASCLLKLDRIPAVNARVSADSFCPVLRPFMERLAQLHAENRGPDFDAVLMGTGHEEIEPGVTKFDIANWLIKQMVWNDVAGGGSLDTFCENVNRNRFHAVAYGAACAAAGPEPLEEIISRTVGALDELRAAASHGKRRRQHTGGGLAGAVREHVNSPEAHQPTTGSLALDQMIGGFARGELHILAGRPGMGKSAMACHSLLKAAQAGLNCQFFSLEMSDIQVGTRLAANLAYGSTLEDQILCDDIQSRRIPETDARRRRRLDAALLALAQLPIIVDEQRGITISEIAARVRKHVNHLSRKGNALDVVFVDHLGLVRPSNRHSGNNRVREIAEITDGLATIAKDLNVAVVALCQLNRGVEGRENKRPSLADLRDSGAIEEDASTVTFVYRPAYYLERLEDDPKTESARIEALTRRRNDLELIVAKNRNGRIGTVELFCDMAASAIRNRDFRGLGY